MGASNSHVQLDLLLGSDVGAANPALPRSQAQVGEDDYSQMPEPTAQVGEDDYSLGQMPEPQRRFDVDNDVRCRQRCLEDEPEHSAHPIKLA